MLPLSRVSGGNCESKVGARRLEEVLLAPHVGGKHGCPVVHVFVDLAIISTIIIIIFIIIFIIIIGITIHLGSYCGISTNLQPLAQVLGYKGGGAAKLVPSTNLTNGSCYLSRCELT